MDLAGGKNPGAWTSELQGPTVRLGGSSLHQSEFDAEPEEARHGLDDAGQAMTRDLTISNGQI